jgi:hypothetical protein
VSRGPWRSKPARDAERLIATAEARGYEVVSIEVGTDGGVRLSLRRPGERDASIEASETLRELV